MLSKQRREDVRQMHEQDISVSEIARHLDIDRKTVRKALSQPWRAYSRAQREDTLLADHAEFLHQRAEHVRYSARVLYQELCRARSYCTAIISQERWITYQSFIKRI